MCDTGEHFSISDPQRSHLLSSGHNSMEEDFNIMDPGSGIIYMMDEQSKSKLN